MMPAQNWTRTHRMGWMAMHGGFFVWAICLVVIAEEHRSGQSSSNSSEGTSQDNAEHATANSTAWTDRQIEALGDPVYGVRAKATSQLIAAGSKVIEPVAMALSSRDREVVRRSQHILERLARSDDAGFEGLRKIASSPQHPSARHASAILLRELDRREQLLASLAEQRRLEAHRLLRDARAALYQGRFAEARQKSDAARALDVSYGLFDDRPDLVQNAIQQTQARLKNAVTHEVITAERN